VLACLVADLVPEADGDDCVRVGIDGVDGAGKTTFADQLGAELRSRGRSVVRVGTDDFHHPRAVRHRRGRDDPEGFWLDSYDYPRLEADVLRPLGPGGSRRFRPKAHDLASDAGLNPPFQVAPPASVLVLDGLFLHRDELRGHWDLSVFLDVPFAVSVARMAARDGSPADPEHPALRRYVEGQRRYFAACRPAERADVLVDHSDLVEPRVLRNPQNRGD
jgi:uridine kinase